MVPSMFTFIDDRICQFWQNTLKDNKSTTGADASVEALKLYHMKLLT